MSRRRVEVLVVFAIVGGLVGLLAVGVQKVREAAARMSCAGHFCMTGVALHSFAATYDDRFPAGTTPHPDLPPDQRLGWWVSVLPYIEQDAVFKQFDLTRGPGDPRNELPASARFRHITCPSSGEHRSGSVTGDHWKSPSPLTHYVGVAGVGADAAALPPGHPRAGVFGHDRRTALKDGFPDGKSNMLLAIETANEPGHWAFGGTATVRAFEREPAYIGPGRPFGGFHNGSLVLVGARTHGCNVVFADGAGRHLTSKIDPAVLEALATVSGKEPTHDW